MEEAEAYAGGHVESRKAQRMPALDVVEVKAKRVVR